MDDGKRIQIVLMGIGTIIDAWKVYLIIRNVQRTENTTVPPELEMSVGNFYLLARSVRQESYRILFSTVLNTVIRAIKISASYYPYVWELSGNKEHTATTRAMRFAASDEIITHGFCMFAYFLLVAIFIESEDPFLSVIGWTIKMTKGALIAAVYTYIRIKVFEELGRTGMLKLFVVFNSVGFVFWALYIFRLPQLRPSKYKKLPHDELGRTVRTLAIGEGYPPERIFMDVKNPFPYAQYSNAIFSEAIVINRSLTIWMGVPQQVAVFAHELGHWKFCHLYYAYFEQFFERTAACILWIFAYGNAPIPRIFGMDPDVHPIVAELLTYRFIWIPFSEVFHGVCKLINAHLEIVADEYACQIWNAKNLKNALMSVSHLLRPTIHYDHWFSAWFIGYPPLAQRISKINFFLDRKLPLTTNT